HVNPDTLKLEDIFNINFPFCEHCGGRLIDVLLLEPSGCDNDGIINYQFTQKVVTVCSDNPYEHSLIKAESYNFTYDIPSYISEYQSVFDDGDEISPPIDLGTEISKYSISNLKFYRKNLNSNLMACA